jgi:sugar phosphate isomerase/epimerase
MEGWDRSAGWNRRAFLKGMAGLAGLGLAAGCRSAASTSRIASAAYWADRPGVQLYTVRSLLQQDFEGTVEQVAAIGYKEVEFAGYYNRTPEQVRQLLDRLDLSAPSTHIGLNPLRENLEQQIQTSLTIGHRYITVPSLPGTDDATPDTWRQFAAEFNRLGAALQARGLRFAFHNHADEFAPAGPGMTGMDILVSETDPDLVSFELDLMWAVSAGQDPVAWFQKYPGRFTMWHVKDLRESANTNQETVDDRMAAVGVGDINFGRIFANAELSGLQHYFVENDRPGDDPIANIRTSYQNLMALLA